MAVSEKKRAQNRAAYQRRKARNRARLAVDPGEIAEQAADVQPELLASDALEVEVMEPAARAPMSFKDRMLARFKDTPEAAAEKKASKGRKKSGNKVEVNFLTKALPIISGLLASNAEKWFAEEYKACAPQRAEVVGILAPIINIIERRIQVSTELSEDTLDLLASGSAALGMVGRIYVTHADIKSGKGKTDAKTERAAAPKHDGASNDPAAREAAILAQFGRGRSDGATAISGYYGNLDPVTGWDVDGLQAQDDADLGAGDNRTDVQSDRAWELATVAKAMRRDASYRATNGLL